MRIEQPPHVWKFVWGSLPIKRLASGGLFVRRGSFEMDDGASSISSFHSVGAGVDLERLTTGLVNGLGK